MSGYQEVATDPSFEGQLVCFTAPMIGNYGTAAERSESHRSHAKGVLMREARGPQWTDWLHEHGVVALTGVDTRSLVLHLRERGAMRAAVVSDGADTDQVLATVRTQPAMAGSALVAGVSTKEPYVFAADGAVRVAVVDYGCKRSILRRLAASGAAVEVFPHDVDADTLAGYDGVLLSPGPGDPSPLSAETEVVSELLGRAPVLGVCLGHQLLALATGRETFKLPFGHRGANHPVLDRRTNRVLVTAQNHGFAVETADDENVTHTSLYDGTVEGLDYPELRARSAQFHPEASPGPHDAASIIVELGRRPEGRLMPRRSRSSLDLPDRLRPDRDRAGGRVRLRRLSGAEGAAGGRVPHDRHQLEPGDDHDRPGLRRPHLPRAARSRRRRRGAAARAPGCPAADDGRRHRTQPGARARRRRDPRRARDRADRRADRGDPARGGSRALQADGRRLRPQGADVAHRHVERRSRKGSRCPRSSARRSRSAAMAAASPTRPSSCTARSCADSPSRRSRRCWSRNRCAAGTSSSSRSCATEPTTS